MEGIIVSAAAAAKSCQSCPTLCDPIDSSPPGSPVPGILQVRTLEWVAISFSNAWKWKVKVKSFSRVRPLAPPWTAAYQAPPSMRFSRQEYWSGVPYPTPGNFPNSGVKPTSRVSPALQADSLPSEPSGNAHAAAAAAKSLQLCPTLCYCIDGSPPGSPFSGILRARTLEWAAISFSNPWKWKVKVKSLSRVRPLATPWTPPSMGFFQARVAFSDYHF